MDKQSKLKRLFRNRENSTCFNCPDRRANCHAHCERYQAEVSKNEADKAKALQQRQLIWDLESYRRDNMEKWYRRCKRK